MLMEMALTVYERETGPGDRLLGVTSSSMQGPRSIFGIGTASSCVVGANERGRRENCRSGGMLPRKMLKFKASEIAENTSNFVNHW